MDNSLIIGGEKNGELDLADWVIVKVPGTGYIGKIARAVFSKVAGVDKDDRIKDFKKKVYGLMKENDGWLELSPAFDYSAPMLPMQDPNSGRRVFSREPVVVPAEFTTRPIPVNVKPTGLIFLAELHHDDKNTYEQFIRGVEEMMLRLRARQTGLVTPGQGMAHG